MHLLGYRESSAPDSAKRRIYVAQKGSGHWRLVLDSSTSSQDPAALDESGEMLSEASRCPVMSFLVHDDDFLETKLFRDGGLQACLHSWPGYFEGKPRTTPTGDFSAWADLLPPHNTIADFRQAWIPLEPVGNILPLLGRVAHVLAMEPESCRLSSDSLPVDWTTQFKILDFQKSSSAVAAIDDLATPGLGYEGGIATTTKLRQGDTSTLFAIAHSTGQTCTGLRVLVWGSALDSPLVAVNRVALTVGTEPTVTVELQDGLSDEGKLLSATLRDLILPAGYPGPAEAFVRAEQDLELGMKLWLSSRVSVELDIRAIAPGAGDLRLAVEPLDHAGGMAHWTTHILVDR